MMLKIEHLSKSSEGLVHRLKMRDFRTLKGPTFNLEHAASLSARDATAVGRLLQQFD
jgi:hypothetical protein